MHENLKVVDDIKNINGNLKINGMSKQQMLNFYSHIPAAPRQVKNSKEIKIQPIQIKRIIEEIFSCVICMQLLDHPVNIKNCLHKFCKKCIDDYNRKEKKECVVCRMEVSNRRVFRNDEKFESIIDTIIKNKTKYKKRIEEYEMDFIKQIPKLVLEKPIQENNCNSNIAINAGLESNNNSTNINNFPVVENDDINSIPGEGNIIRIKKSKNKSPENESHQKLSQSLNEQDLNRTVSNYSDSNDDSDEESSPRRKNKKCLKRKTKREEDDSSYTEDAYRQSKRQRTDQKLIESLISREQMENMMRSKGNFITVHLECENNSSWNIFKNLVLYTNDSIPLEDFSIYILNRRKINQKLLDNIVFYVKDNEGVKHDLNDKKLSLKQIKQTHNNDSTSNKFILFFKVK